MLRQFCIISIAVAVALIGTVADSRTAEAQGFFRRLQDRILSRDEPAAETEQTPQSQTALPRQPQYAPNLKPGEPQGDGPLADIDLDRFGHSILYREPPANVVSPPAANATVSLGRPSLGISVVESKSGVPGLQVDSIRTDSMADEAGLKEGDLIIAIDGTPTPAIATVVQHLEGRKIGDRVRATVVSETKTKTISIQLVADVVATAKPQIQEPAPAPKDLGVKVEQSPGVRGLIVSAVEPDSPADAAGLRVGDRIVSIDGRLLVNVAAFNRELESRSNGEGLTLQLVRDGKLIVAEIVSSNSGELVKTTTPTAANGSGSVLEGFGSVLGGLLGGNGKPKTDAVVKADGTNVGQDEGVKQAGFESPTERAAKKLKSDPPSLEGLEVPASPIELKAPDQGTNSDKTIEALREEVRRLQERLEQLDEKQEE
jgi:membrane-associated protease RseP (regulator of RpoE activity)